MSELTTYRLCLATSTKVMVLGILGFMTVMGLAIPFASATSGSAPPALFAVVWFGALGLCWYQVLSVPQAIVHHFDDRLEFKAPIRTRSLSIAELRSIEPVPNQFGMLRFSHANGKINILNQFDGFHELIAVIKAKNPNVQIRGC